MPTVRRFDGFRVAIYPNDHRPAHVHVIASSGEAVFLLNCPGGPLELRESYGFRLAELKRIAATVSESVEHLCAIWDEYHGDH
jgi:hypothetical protein